MPHTEIVGNEEEDNVQHFADDATHQAESQPIIREGLPATYRMRADAHYVEQLDTRVGGPSIQCLSVTTISALSAPLGDPIPTLVKSIARFGVLQPLLVQRCHGSLRLIDGRKRLRAAAMSGLSEVPCIIHDVEDRETMALADAANILQRQNEAAVSPPSPSDGIEIYDPIAGILSTIELALPLLASLPSSLPHTTATDLIRAETWRAATLLKAWHILRHGIPLVDLTCSVRGLLTAVAQRAEPARRLRGVVLESDFGISQTVVIAGDPLIFETALSGLLIATSAAVAGHSHARVHLAASVQSTSHVEITVSQEGGAMSPAWESRAFDAAWEHPGGPSASLWMLAARTVAESSGGRLIVSQSGSRATVAMVIPMSTA